MITHAKRMKVEVQSLLEIPHLNIFPNEDVYLETQDTFIDLNTGVCLDKHFVPYKQTLLEYIWWRNGNAKGWLCKHGEDDLQTRIDTRVKNAYTFCTTLQARTIVNLPSDVIYVNLLHSLGFYMFGHLFDTLHKLEDFTKHNTHKHVCFLVSDTTTITEFETYIKILAPGIQFSLLETKKLNQYNNILYKCQNLIIISPTARPTKFKSYTNYKYVYDCFSNYYKGYVPSVVGSNKLFVTRNPPLKRNVINFNTIQRQLEKQNIHIIYGNESLADTHYYYSNASHICGYHGSALANVIFCNSETRVFEYCAKNRSDLSFVTKIRKFTDYYIKFIKADTDFNAKLNIKEMLEFYNYSNNTDKRVAFFGSTTLQYTKLIEYLEDCDAAYRVMRSFNKGHFIKDSVETLQSIESFNSDYCVIDWFRTVYNTPRSTIIRSLDILMKRFNELSCKVMFLLLPEKSESREQRRVAVECLINYCKENSIFLIDCNEYFTNDEITHFTLTDKQSKIIANKIDNWVCTT